MAPHRLGHLWVSRKAAEARRHRTQAGVCAVTALLYKTSPNPCYACYEGSSPLFTQGRDTESLDSQGRKVFATGKAIMLMTFLQAFETRNIIKTSDSFSWRPGRDFPSTATLSWNQIFRLE